MSDVLHIAGWVGRIQVMLKKYISAFLKLIWKFIQFTFWLILWLFAIGALLFFITRWFSDDYFSVIRAVNFVVPWLLILLIPTMLIAGLLKRKWLLLTASVPVLLICFSFVPLFLPKENPSPHPNSFSLKIMSLNLFFQEDARPLLKLIRQHQPDILVIQELHPNLTSIPLDDLADLYPDLYIDVVDQPEKAFVQAIMSRYPIIQADAEFDKGRVQKGIIQTPAGPIAVWNIHPIPPFRVSSQWHDQQVSELLIDISLAEGPFIVAGDLNATDQSTTYQGVKRYLRNAHTDAGRGLGFTFPAPPYTKGLPFYLGPLYRIDHIFYSDHFIATDAKTLADTAGSDHLPVTAELWLQ